MPKADTREAENRLEPLRRAGWEITALKYGDYEGEDAVEQKWIIEHKTVAKLLEDMRTGVLQRQCQAVVEHCIFPILLIEGQWLQSGGYLLNTSYTWEQVWNQLQTLQDMGMRLQLTSSPSHTVQRLFELEAYYKKEQHPSAVRHLSGSLQIACLSQIEGIGAEKAKSILGYFGSLCDTATAGVKKLQECPGIGGILAQRIYDFWRRNDREII